MVLSRLSELVGCGWLCMRVWFRVRVAVLVGVVTVVRVVAGRVRVRFIYFQSAWMFCRVKGRHLRSSMTCTTVRCRRPKTAVCWAGSLHNTLVCIVATALWSGCTFDS